MNEAELERLGTERGKHRYRSSLSRFRENGEETDTVVGSHLLSDAVPYVAKELKSWKLDAKKLPGKGHAALPLLELLNETLTALLISRAVLNSISFAQNMTTLAISIGTAVEQEYRLICLERDNPKIFAAIKESIWRSRGTERQRNYFFNTYKLVAGVTAPRWPVDDRIRVGLVGLDLFIRATGMCEVQTSYSAVSRRNKSVVVPTYEMVTWLHEAHEFQEVLRPFYSPMVDKPVSYIDTTIGGYLTTPLPLFKSGEDASILTPENSPAIFKAVNSVQDTGWQVNKQVKHIAEHMWDNQIELPGLPASNPIPFPVKPRDIDTNIDSRRSYSTEKARVIAVNNKMKNQKLSVARLLQAAEKFSGVSSFYMPQQLDFRGRMYSLPSVLNNQGNDLTRSLLKFDSGKPLCTKQDWDAFYIEGAHRLCLPGMTLDDKVKFIEENRCGFVEIGADPLAHVNVWSEAKEPWQFLAWCIELSEIDADPTYPSCLPCSIDGTNHGCQIWSLIMRDKVTGDLTNCSYSAEPQDLYRSVAHEVTSRLNDGYFGQAWRSLGVCRGTVKGAVMIIPYAATLHGVANSIASWVEKERAVGVSMPWENDMKASIYLARIVWDVLPSFIPAVHEGMEYLQGLAATAAKYNIPVSWELPTGLRVTNKYRKKKLRKVRTRLGKRYHVSYLHEPTEELSVRRQTQTIAANYTHSYDAALLMETVCRAEEVSHFSMIHDSYGTHAVDVAKLSRAVRESAAEIFNDPCILKRVKDSLQDKLSPFGVTLPEPPPFGLLNPEEVVDSRYFFH